MSKHLLSLKTKVAAAIRARDWPRVVETMRDLCRLEDTTENHMQLASACLRIDRVEEARVIYARQDELHPNNQALKVNLGICEYRLGEYERALGRFEAVLAKSPDYYLAKINAARSLYQLGSYDKTKIMCQRILETQDQQAEVYDLLGHSCYRLGHLADALQWYRRSIAINPGNAKIALALAITCSETRDTKNAIFYYEKCIELGGDIQSASKNLASIYLALGPIQRAIRLLRGVIERDPNDHKAYHNLGLANLKLGRLEAAKISFQTAVDLNPDYVLAWSHLVQVRTLMCDFDVYADPSVTDADRAEGGVLPFAFLTIEDNPWNQLRRSRGFVREHCKTPEKVFLCNDEVRAEGPIRLGYFSSDFKPHATMFLFNQVLNRHDGSRFQVFLYDYTGSDDPQILRALVRPEIVIRDISNYTDSDVAGLARKDQLDIAVDLKGFTENSRSAMFAHRLAPVQVNYLGYPGSVGAEWMDYIVADDHVLPERLESCYTEKVARMPHSYQPNNDSPLDFEAAIDREALGLPLTAVVLCCFNQNYKITPREISVWSQILHRVPDSVAWLLRSNRWAEENIRSAFHKLGIEKERLVFADKVDHPTHLCRHLSADLFLDTFSVNAHTSASDALRASLPVITLPGEQFAARVAASLLHAVGVTDTIAGDESRYIELAVDLATDSDKRKEMRSRLRHSFGHGHLFDPSGYVSNFETLLEQMHQRRLQGLPPANLR
jgi:protein O-GlcNAc transferase